MSEAKTYKVRYRYVDPSRAGPFKGSTVVNVKRKRGEEIYAVFGRAIVTSCKEIKDNKYA